MKKPKTIIIFLFPVLAVAITGAVWLFGAHNKPPVFAASLPAIYAETETVSYGVANLLLRPLGALSAAAGKDEEGIRYADAYAETDVVKTVFENKIKEDIILKKPGHPAEFRYELDLKGLLWEKDEQGNFVFYQEKTPIFRIPAPYLIDADGNASSFRVVETFIRDNILTIRPDADWLSSHPYPITLDPTIELVILDVHSHPAAGDDWIVSFTTAGRFDLKIIPNDQATIDDDEFVSLWCGGEQRIPQILAGDVIYYQDWECAGQGQVIHNTLRAGDHILRFEFGGEIAYAYNSYSANRKYAWSENAGWLNASSTDEQVLVASAGLTGYLWGENIGWIKLDYDGIAGATNTTATDWGVTNDGRGNLAGYAWGENIGWVNFDPTDSQVMIDYDTGQFAGAAWAENIGWINFGHSEAGYTLLFAPLAPALTTRPAGNIGSLVVTAYAHAFDGGGAISERGFKYGLTEADTWSVSETGTFNSGNFEAVIEGLSPDTEYYIRAYAVNSEGTSYGEYVSFSTEAAQKGSPVIFNEKTILKGPMILK